MRRTLFGLAVPLVALALASAAAADTVDNPQYQEWAKWKEGTYVTLKSESTIDGKVQLVGTTTQTLKSLTAEKAVVEVVSVSEIGGQTVKGEPITLEIPAKLTIPKTDPKEKKTDPKEAPKVKESKGTETLTVNGKKLVCEWHQIELDGVTLKTWSSEEVPERLVKMESRAKEGSTTVRLTEWKAEKR